MRWKELCISVMGSALTSMALYFPYNSHAEVKDQVADEFFNLELSDNVSDLQSKNYNSDNIWSVKGSLDFQNHYAVNDQLDSLPFSRDNSGVTMVRATLRLNASAKLRDNLDVSISGLAFYDAFYYSNRDDFTTDEFNDFSDEFELRDAYIQFETIDNLWLKIGRQVIAFGESDFTQIIDVINPRDERQFGLVDLEDARLPVAATRLSYVGNRWGLDWVLVHEFDSHRFAGKGSDFDPYIMLRDTISLDNDRKPKTGFDDPGNLFRAFFSHAHGDINLVLARSYVQSPILALSPRGNSSFDKVYPKVTTYGLSANWVEGFWLLKGEVARKENSFVARSDIDQQRLLGFGVGELYATKDIVQSLLGVEYTLDQDIQLSTELTTTRILQYEKILLPKQVESTLSSRVVFEFYRDTAQLEILWSHWLNDDSDIMRVTYRYDHSDKFQWSLGYIGFWSGEENSVLHPYRKNDRLFWSATYSF